MSPFVTQNVIFSHTATLTFCEGNGCDYSQCVSCTCMLIVGVVTECGLFPVDNDR